MQLALIMSSNNIPVELHVVVCLFTRPYFLFSLSNFPTGCGTEGLGTRLSSYGIFTRVSWPNIGPVAAGPAGPAPMALTVTVKPGVATFIYNHKCVNCSESDATYGWTAYIAAQLLPVTMLFVIVVVFQVSAVTPSMNAFVFTCQLTTLPEFY